MAKKGSKRAAARHTPTTRVRYRQGLATVLGRAIVLDGFLNDLRNGTDVERKALALALCRVALDEDDLKAMNEMDWEAAAAAAASLRATLPERQGGALGPDLKELSGW